MRPDRIGYAFKEIFQNGIRRDDVWVTSKLWNDKHGEDVSDWLDAGHTTEEWTAIVQATPILKAEDLPASDTPSRDKQL